MSNKVYKVVAGIDLGNGYVKSGIKVEDAKQKTRLYPSVALKKYDTYLDDLIAQPDDAFTDDIINRMDLSFVSPTVSDTLRRTFGQSALTSGMPLEQFDVHSPVSKASVDISGVLVLGLIAAEVFNYVYETEAEFPMGDKIKAEVNLATALPIEEYRQYHREYASKYLNNGDTHTVTFHNFERPVAVEIVINEVHIANEGEAAQYGLMFADDDFLKVIEKSVDDSYPEGTFDIAGEDYISAQNTLGIDIGEGTIDFAVFTDGRFNPTASSTMSQGYGNVLENTLDTLQREGTPYKSRKQLSELIYAERNAFNRGRIERIEEVNQAHVEQFASIVADEVSKVFNRVGGFVDVIFVYGGGAGPLERALFKRINDRIEQSNLMQGALPIVYLDSGYSRYLNLHGLVKLAEYLED